VHRIPLNHDIDGLHLLHCATIKNALRPSIEQDTIVERLCPMHHALIPRSQIDVASDSSSSASKSNLAIVDLIVVLEVGIVVEVGRIFVDVRNTHWHASAIVLSSVGFTL